MRTGTFPAEPPEPDPNGATIIMGSTLLYSFIAGFFDNVPPMYEMYHYPFLFAGWLGLFFTALKSDAGRVNWTGDTSSTTLIGYEKHKKVARIAYTGITALGGVEMIPFLYITLNEWFPGFGVRLYSNLGTYSPVSVRKRI
jgi:hypothetical protein